MSDACALADELEISLTGEYEYVDDVMQRASYALRAQAERIAAADALHIQTKNEAGELICTHCSLQSQSVTISAFWPCATHQALHPEKKI